jgi:hypothetical protein
MGSADLKTDEKIASLLRRQLARAAFLRRVQPFEKGPALAVNSAKIARGLNHTEISRAP